MEKPKVEVSHEHVLLYLQQMAIQDRTLAAQISAAKSRAAFDLVEQELRELKAKMGENPLKVVEEPNAAHS